MHTPLYNQYGQKEEARSHPLSVFSWEQAALAGALVVIGYLFVRLGNGFPPRVWGEFAQFVRGERIDEPFQPVLLQSFLYLVGWLLLLLTGLHGLRPAFLSPLYRSDTRERRALSTFIRAAPDVISTKKASRSAVDKSAEPTASSESHRGSEPSTPSGLLTQFTASSREYTAPTAFCLRGEVAPGISPSGAARAALTGAFLCQPGRRSDGKGVEDALMIASGLCRAPTYASSSDQAPFTLFIVASGYSDERLQQAVSRICVQAISYALSRALAKNASFTQEGLESLLGKSIQRTNAMLYQHNQKHTSTSTATVTTILIVSGIAYVAHAGNHRAYLYRPRKGFKHLTRDRAAEAINRQAGDAGRSSGGDGMLGRQAQVRVQTHQMRLQADDLLILCSHGFWQRVSQAAFLQLVKDEIEAEQPAVTRICRAFLQAERIKEGEEPISAIVARAGLF